MAQQQPFILGACPSRVSKDTWNNRQVWPWSKNWSRAKANRVLPRECTNYTNQWKHPFPTIQEITLHIHVTKWSIPKSDWLHSLQLKMERLYHISSVQLLSHVRLFATPWTAARQASLSITNSQSLLSPLSRWCHPTISSSVIPFSSCHQSFPASGSLQMS